MYTDVFTTLPLHNHNYSECNIVYDKEYTFDGWKFESIFAVLQYFTMIIKLNTLLNQAHAWFLKITSVRMYVCVCVSAPEAMNN